MGAEAGKWRKHWEKRPGNEKRRERSLSALWRLVLGLVFPKKNKKLPERNSLHNYPQKVRAFADAAKCLRTGVYAFCQFVSQRRGLRRTMSCRAIARGAVHPERNAATPAPQSHVAGRLCRAATCTMDFASLVESGRRCRRNEPYCQWITTEKRPPRNTPQATSPLDEFSSVE